MLKLGGIAHLRAGLGDTPLSSLMDSTASLKVIIAEGEGVGVRSVATPL
jgi:hypothetical protein